MCPLRVQNSFMYDVWTSSDEGEAKLTPINVTQTCYIYTYISIKRYDKFHKYQKINI